MLLPYAFRTSNRRMIYDMVSGFPDNYFLHTWFDFNFFRFLSFHPPSTPNTMTECKSHNILLQNFMIKYSIQLNSIMILLARPHNQHQSNYNKLREQVRDQNGMENVIYCHDIQIMSSTVSETICVRKVCWLSFRFSCRFAMLQSVAIFDMHHKTNFIFEHEIYTFQLCLTTINNK